MIRSYNKSGLFFVMTALTLLPACWPFNRSINAQNKNFYLINVLDKAAFDDCRIAGSINVPFDQVESFAQKLDKNTQIVVYCANYACTASGQAAKQLKNLGFQNVWAYEGGTAQWYQLGRQHAQKYPIEGACKAGYLNAPNEQSQEEEDSSVPVITAQELYDKMLANKLISLDKEGYKAAA